MFTPNATAKEAPVVAELKKRVPSDLLDPDDRDFLDDGAYLRFLRARKGNVDKAAAMLQKTIEWRKTVKPYAITADSVTDTMDCMKMVCGGRCKDGCPVILLALTKAENIPMEARRRNLLFMLEETRRKGYDRVTWIIDWGHITKHKKEEREDEESKRGGDERKERKEVMESLSDHYPERLEKMLLFRAPLVIRLLLPFIRFTVDSHTSAKVHSIGSSVKELEKFVERGQLPQECEGAMQGVVMTHFAELPSLTAH